MTTNITINILLLAVTNWIGIDGPNEVGLVRTNTVLEAVCEGRTNQFTLKTEDSFRYVLRPAEAVVFTNSFVFPNPLDNIILLPYIHTNIIIDQRPYTFTNSIPSNVIEACTLYITR